MRPQAFVLSVVFAFSLAGTALAVEPEKKLEFKESPMGTVIFDGTTHKNAGLTCSDCHNTVIFPEMKKGGVRITMNDLYAGKYCGGCHNGEKAFKILGNCAKCHHEK